MINDRTRLHVVSNGTMTGQRYIDEVLLPHVRLFRGAVGDKFVFMDDNATCHRTLAVQDCLDSEGIQRLVWPARSPDLIPVENVAFGDGPVAGVSGGQGIKSWLACLEFEPSATKDPPCRAVMHVKSIES
ncbi:transposable element Tc1 transposase [Trichonephila clavipes]|nr:transposable element Tc1 transposase [Trichonephila clavipes]